MDDAISRSAVHVVINSQIFDTEYPSELDELEKLINELPALDVAPVVHGKFVRQTEEVIPNLRANPLLCKTCNTTFITVNKEGKRCICCSYCGARMDGEEDESD